MAQDVLRGDAEGNREAAEKPHQGPKLGLRRRVRLQVPQQGHADPAPVHPGRGAVGAGEIKALWRGFAASTGWGNAGEAAKPGHRIGGDQRKDQAQLFANDQTVCQN